MSAHVERARLLLAQGRHSEAEQEVTLALAVQPENVTALGLLALIRTEQRNEAGALDAARQAVGLAPDHPFAHYVHGIVLHQFDQQDAAYDAVQEAIRLNPQDPDLFALVAGIEISRRDWSSALFAAEQALALDPEHIQAANLRSMALVRLGRKAEATETIDAALQREPDNAMSHANQGWNCLHRNQPRQAQEHFREALRLDPSLDYAREGMLQALNARNPVYRAMLAYFLWMGRLSGRLQWAVIIAVWFGSRFVRTLAVDHPSQAILWWTLLLLLYGFVYLTWTAQPMFNLLLRLDRFGRHVLSPDQRVATNWFGGTLLAALAALTYGIAKDNGLALIAMLGLIALSICVAATFTRRGPSRRKLAYATLALVVVGVSGLALAATGHAEIAGNVGMIFTVGFIAFQLFANMLR